MRATDIRGYALDGAAYCVKHTPASTCACERDENGFCSENCGGYGPNPIFGSDEFDGTCDECFEEII